MGFVIGTIGHVDHGKTSVIKTLTNILTYRHKEEIERDITIDIGFAYLHYDDIGIVSIIDVPGHKDYIHNMLTGIFGVKLAILVIDANEGIMPQTIEHLEIAKLCDIQKLIVVLNKIDLVDNTDIEYRILEIEELLKNTKFENSKIIPFSCINNFGKDILNSTIHDEIIKINQTTNENRNLVLFPIDRVIEKSFGQILTGTLISGTLKKDEIYKIIPKGECKVRSIESHFKQYETLNQNIRAAINITKINECELKRGSFVISNELNSCYQFIIAKISILKDCKFKIKSGLNIKFYFYTACYNAKLRLLDKTEASANNELYVEIIFDKPQFILLLKPFIIRLHTDEITIGGGIILDCSNSFTKNKKIILNTLPNINDINFNTFEVIIKNYLTKKGFINIAKAYLIFLTSIDKLIPILNQYLNENFIIIKKQFLTTHNIIKNISNKIIEIFKEYLKLNSLEKSIDKNKLIKLCINKNYLYDIEDIEFYNFIIEDLINNKIFELNNGLITFTNNKDSFNNNLDSEMLILINKIFKIFHEKKLEPINYDEFKKIVPKNKIEFLSKIIKYLESENKIFKIFENYYISFEQLNIYKDIVKQICNFKNSFTVSEFKEKTKLSRKFVIPILEYLDKISFTIRIENERMIKNNP